MSKKTRLPAPQYSYRQSLKKEDLKVYRRIALLITAFFVILLVIWFMGTSFINTLSYIQNGNPSSSNTQTSANDLPLLAPTIDKLPNAINTDTISVSGETTISVTVTLYVNTVKVATTTSDSSGNFKFDNVKLTVGSNIIKAVASNKSEKQESTPVTIVLDITKPSLVVNAPVDGSTYPSTTTNVTVSGVTEPNAIVHVSGNQAIVDPAGNFSYLLPVIAGDNIIEVNAVDNAGNTTVVKLTVTVSPAAAPPASPSQ